MLRSRRLARRDLLRSGLAAALLGVARPLRAQRRARVVFLNPGEAVERGAGPQWPLAARFMTLAAQALGLELEVLYAERDHLMMLRQAEQVAQRGDAPDYVVIVNEKSTAPQMLDMLERSPARVLVIHNDLTPEQRRAGGNERERHARWIGSVVADNARGGWRLMEALYRALGGREPHILGITGDPSTPVSHERAQGVQDFVDRTGRGRLLQLVHGNWTTADGEQKARVLLARYPQANVIWAANDSMALGALHAVPPGGAVLVGGMGGFPEALDSIAAGALTASAAGHYLIGGWAMVLLHDHFRGADFAEHGGAAQKLDFLYVVDRERVARYQQLVMRGPEAIDYRAFSKVLNPKAGGYDFRLDALLRGKA